MALGSEIYSALTGSTLITALTTNRIYPSVLPQETEYPAIMYTRIANVPLYALDGYMGKANPTIRVDIFTTSYANSKTLASNVHTVLTAASSFAGRMLAEIDLFEPRGNVGKDLHRVSQDYSIWGDE